MSRADRETHARAGYSGSTIAVPRTHRYQVAFFSRKCHLARCRRGRMNCGTALEVTNSLTRSVRSLGDSGTRIGVTQTLWHSTRRDTQRAATPHKDSRGHSHSGSARKPNILLLLFQPCWGGADVAFRLNENSAIVSEIQNFLRMPPPALPWASGEPCPCADHACARSAP